MHISVSSTQSLMIKAQIFFLFKNICALSKYIMTEKFCSSALMRSCMKDQFWKPPLNFWRHQVLQASSTFLLLFYILSKQDVPESLKN